MCFLSPWCGHAIYFSKKARKENGAREGIVENGMGRMNGRKVDELIGTRLASFPFFLLLFLVWFFIFVACLPLWLSGFLLIGLFCWFRV